jgi:DNA-binding NarL/FixJ family response regulator
LVEGLSNTEIAERLIIGRETVKTHVSHIMDKLAVSDRIQAAVKALRHGLV